MIQKIKFMLKQPIFSPTKWYLKECDALNALKEELQLTFWTYIYIKPFREITFIVQIICVLREKNPILLNNHMLQIVKIQILDDLENPKLQC